MVGVNERIRTDDDKVESTNKFINLPALKLQVESMDHWPNFFCQLNVNREPSEGAGTGASGSCCHGKVVKGASCSDPLRPPSGGKKAGLARSTRGASSWVPTEPRSTAASLRGFHLLIQQLRPWHRGLVIVRVLSQESKYKTLARAWIELG